jgi:hypothetical protein
MVRGIETNQKAKGKGKAIPLQTLTGPEGFNWLKLPHFNTIDK